MNVEHTEKKQILSRKNAVGFDSLRLIAKCGARKRIPDHGKSK
jgi:hypothetical protein